LKSDILTNFTGGPRGIQKISGPTLFGKPFASDIDFMFLIICGVLLAVFVYSRLQHSRTGRAWLAIREDELVARASGVNTVTYKLLALAIGAAFAGLAGGIYASRNQFTGPDEGRLSTDSVILQLPILIDRSNEITITSPMTQALVDALRIEGSISKIGNEGVQIEVRGPEGTVFGPEWIGTTEILQSGAGEFTKKVIVTRAGEYDVYFKDVKGYIGVKTFTVTAPATTSPTTVRTTTAVTTRPPTTVPTPIPTTPQSPLSPMTIVGALAFVGLVSIVLMKKR
jgi:hypothetical protein